jgi:4-aminobutyrate aminotransferase-like enzyme
MKPALITKIPGPRSQALAQDLTRYESRNITFITPQFPIFWERARWANVWDVDGNRYLDFTSAFGVAGVGYSQQPIIDAIQHQSHLLIHGMGDVHPNAPKVDLCRILSAWTYESWGRGEGKCILTNSGSEAVEAALATAYLATKKPGIITFKDSYHGLTLAARSITGLPEFRHPFKTLLLPKIFSLPYPTCARCGLSETNCSALCRSAWENEAEDLLKHHAHEIGAIIIEPIQGRGGNIIPPDWLLPRLREYCDTYNILLIADEIFTGGWRTGKRFACDWTQTIPDLICLSKSMTGGFPLGACIGSAPLMDQAWPPSTGESLFTSTHLGHPIGCRMAIAAIASLEDPALPKRINDTGRFFLQSLKNLAETFPQRLKHARGRGLMLGIDFIDQNNLPRPDWCAQTVIQSLQRGLIILSGGPDHHILTLTPPFCIERDDILYFESTMQSIIAELQ